MSISSDIVRFSFTLLKEYWQKILLYNFCIFLIRPKSNIFVSFPLFLDKTFPCKTLGLKFLLCHCFLNFHYIYIYIYISHFTLISYLEIDIKTSYPKKLYLCNEHAHWCYEWYLDVNLLYIIILTHFHHLYINYFFHEYANWNLYRLWKLWWFWNIDYYVRKRNNCQPAKCQSMALFMSEFGHNWQLVQSLLDMVLTVPKNLRRKNRK